MGAFDSIKERIGTIVKDKWIAWIHEGYREYDVDYTQPAYVYDKQLRKLREGGHLTDRCCAKCIALNSCHFAEWNMPTFPLHRNCHCGKMKIANPIPNKTAFAHCPIEKFENYVYAKESASSKRNFFENYAGYYVEDSEYLQREFESQALERYVKGDYELQTLDGQGQRILIHIYLRGYDIETGWMIRPNGVITNNTPYRDHARRDK